MSDPKELAARLRQYDLSPTVQSEAADLIASQAARIAELEADAAECYVLREKMAGLLTGVANALRGAPPPLTLWSWHDLPERAAAAISAIDVMQRAASALATKNGCELEEDRG